MMGTGMQLVKSQATSGTSQGLLPDSARVATDWVTARIVGRSAGSTLTEEQGVRLRHLLKSLRAWESLSKRQQLDRWRAVMTFLTIELLVPSEDLARPFTSLTKSDVTVKDVHELVEHQLSDLAIRRKAAAMLAQDLPPKVILEALGGARSRAWLYQLKRRLAMGSALDDRRTANRGNRRYGETPRLLLEQVAFDPMRRPPVTTAYKRLRAECIRMGAEPPSIAWMRDQLRHNPQLMLLHQAGPDEYRRKDRPSVITKDQGVLPGEIYEIDSTPLDVWVRIMRPDGEWVPIRPLLTCVIDVGSRAVMGIHLTLGNATQASVAQAFLHAILPKAEAGWPMHGKPRTLRMDRGGEYGTAFISAVEASGVAVEWSPPRYPDARGKGERFFGTLNNFIHGLPGTTEAIGTDDASVMKALPYLLTVDDLTEAIRLYVTTDYHMSVHSGTNATPGRLWVSAARSLDAREEEIAALLPYSRTVQVTHGHLDFQVDNERHTFMAEFLIDFLRQQVFVRWCDLGAVHVFDSRTNRYLGIAVSAHHEIADEVAENIKNSRREGARALESLKKKAKARSLADASMTPTVQRQIAKHMEEAKRHQLSEVEARPAPSREELEMRKRLEGRFE